jgi:hypothetical protein
MRAGYFTAFSNLTGNVFAGIKRNVYPMFKIYYRIMGGLLFGLVACQPQEQTGSSSHMDSSLPFVASVDSIQQPEAPAAWDDNTTDTLQIAEKIAHCLPATFIFTPAGSELASVIRTEKMEPFQENNITALGGHYEAAVADANGSYAGILQQRGVAMRTMQLYIPDTTALHARIINRNSNARGMDTLRLPMRYKDDQAAFRVVGPYFIAGNFTGKIVTFKANKTRYIALAGCDGLLYLQVKKENKHWN